MRRTLALLFSLALASALALVLVQGVLAQEAMKVLAPAAFKKPQRPPAVFVHDQHNEKAKLADCVACHHGGQGGKQDKSASTEGTPCADCHKVTPEKGRTGLQKAYHSQCIGCHRKQAKGPVACGQCHKRQG